MFYLLNVGLFTFFSIIITTALYVSLDANVNTTLWYLHSAINKQNNYSQVDNIITCDFYSSWFEITSAKHIKFARQGNVLDKAYSNIKCEFKSTPLPHKASQTMLSILLTSKYTSSGEKVNLQSGISRGCPGEASVW